MINLLFFTSVDSQNGFICKNRHYYDNFSLVYFRCGNILINAAIYFPSFYTTVISLFVTKDKLATAITVSP